MHGGPGGRAAAYFDKLSMSGSEAEESPGSTKQGWRVTPAGREGFGLSVKGKCHREQTAKPRD